MRQAPSRRYALVGVLTGTAVVGLSAGVVGAAALARWAARRPAPHWSDLSAPADQAEAEAGAPEDAAPDDAGQDAGEQETDLTRPVTIDLSPVIPLIRATGASWSEPAIAAYQG